MSAQDKIAIAYAEAGRARRSMLARTMPTQAELPIAEQLIQAFSRGAGVVALFGAVAAIGWLTL